LLKVLLKMTKRKNPLEGVTIRYGSMTFKVTKGQPVPEEQMVDLAREYNQEKVFRSCDYCGVKILVSRGNMGPSGTYCMNCLAASSM
jgi:hypothetical protein